MAGRAVELCFDSRPLQVFGAAVVLLGVALLASFILIGCLARKLRLQTKRLREWAVCSAASTLSGYDTLPRDTHSPNRLMSTAPPSVISGSMRSISEITVPGSGWVRNLTTDHQIPRLQPQKQIF